jgi:hypothetical protein
MVAEEWFKQIFDNGFLLLLPAILPGEVPSGRLANSTNEIREPTRYQAEKSSDGSVIVCDKSEMTQEAVYMAMISDAVSKKIFPYKKFVQWDEELEHGSKVQRAICRELNVTKKNSIEFWRKYKEKTRYKMTKKRNNVLEQLRRAMIGT